MKNILQITPHCFIVRTQAGFKRLCNYLRCGVPEYDYTYQVEQITNDENAFEYEKILGMEVKCQKQYPIKYPCIISVQDETFEQGNYYFYIKYVTDDLRIKDFVETEGFRTINNKKNRYDD